MKRLLAILVGTTIAFSANAVQAQDPLENLNKMVASGDYDAARAYIRSLTSDQSEWLLLEAQIKTAEGSFSQAIDIYRKILAVSPDNLFVRQQLAQTLEINRNYASATHHYGELLKRDPDPNSQRFYSTRMKKISDYTPFGMSMSLGVRPSSNINNASTKTIATGIFGDYEIPDELRPNFGWKMDLGLDGFYKARIADNQQVIFRSGIDITRYSVETINASDWENSLTWRYETAKHTLNVTPFLRRNWGDGEIYSTLVYTDPPSVAINSRNEDSWTKGVRVSGNIATPSPYSFFYSGNFQTETFDDQEELGYSDNYQWGGTAGIEYLLDDRSQVSAWARMSQFRRVQGGHYVSSANYDSQSIGASYEHVWASGWQGSASYEFTSREYQADYYSIGSPRSDVDHSLGLEFANQNWKIGNFLPKMNCYYDITSSNVSELESKGGGCGIRVTQSF